MSARKSERIMNLTICLLMARRFLPKEHIRGVVEGYAGLSDAAFERAFERDKDELRRMGVPIETGSNDPLFPDDVGYRIRRRNFELPPISFDAAETAVLGVAAGVWEQTRLAGHTVRAVAKLRAAGIEPDASRVSSWLVTVAAPEPAFETLWDAYLNGFRGRFRYRGVERHVEPWHLANRRDWFVIGMDLGRGEGRSFKLSRIEGELELDTAGPPIERPGDEVIAAYLASLEPALEDETAVVALRDGAAVALRRGAEPLPDRRVPDGFTAHRVRLAGDAVGELAAFADDIVVMEPPELADSVRARWQEVADRWS